MMDGGSGETELQKKKKIRVDTSRGETKFPGLVTDVCCSSEDKGQGSFQSICKLVHIDLDSTSILSVIGQCNQIDVNSKKE